jgi:hypothetical protein
MRLAAVCRVSCSRILGNPDVFTSRSNRPKRTKNVGDRVLFSTFGPGSSERCSSTSRAGQHETAALETRLPEPRRLRSTQLQRRPSSDIIK